MRLLPRLVILAALGWLLFIFISEARHQATLENPDNVKTILLFGGTALVGLAMGSLVALSLLPMFGDWVGSFFFNPNQEIEKNPHSAAMARIAQGDYSGAVEEYRKVIEKNPSDMHAVSEIVHLYCDKLHEPEPAAELLEQVLGGDLPAEDGAFLASRLVDVYWNHQHDAVRARALLLQIAESLPDTKHAANAMHRLREIEHALAMGELPVRPADMVAQSHQPAVASGEPVKSESV